MFEENTLFWVFPIDSPLSKNKFLLIAACEAPQNKDYEVEFVVFAGIQRSENIRWVCSFTVDDCTIDDEENLYEYAFLLAQNNAILEKAKKVLLKHPVCGAYP